MNLQDSLNNFLHSPSADASSGTSTTLEKLRVGIIGGAGYTGGELIRILINHPNVEIAFIHSESNAGKFVYEIHSDLIGETNLKFADTGLSHKKRDLEGLIDV